MSSGFRFAGLTILLVSILGLSLVQADAFWGLKLWPWAQKHTPTQTEEKKPVEPQASSAFMVQLEEPEPTASALLKPVTLNPAQLQAPLLRKNQLRVGLSDDALEQLAYPSTRVSATSAFTLKASQSATVLWQGLPEQVLEVSAQNGQLSVRVLPPQAIETSTEKTPVINKAAIAPKELGRFAGPLWLEPTETGGQVELLSITRKGVTPRYRGRLELRNDSGYPNKLVVINELDLDDYLKAVVPNELPIAFGLEAVRAQAVAARNYAVRPRERPWHQFDICDSQYCQAYYGAHTETEATTQALKETEGLVELYQGEPILALFSSSHGGFSEAYSNAFSDPATFAFPAPALPYLQARADAPARGYLSSQSPASNAFTQNLSTEAEARQFWTNPNIPSYDSASSLYRWQARWSAEELSQTLDKSLNELSGDPVTKRFIQPLKGASQPFGKLLRLEVTRRGRSGKAMDLQITSTGGQWHLQKEYLIRKALRMPGQYKRYLPSANVVFSHLSGANKRLEAVLAQGGGFGHGVGLSQFGASGMAKAGAKFPEILQHYYPATALGSLPLTLHGSLRQSTHFFWPTTLLSSHHSAQLMLQWPSCSPSLPEKAVTLGLNGKTYRLQTGNTSGLLAVPIAGLLKRNASNTLELFPNESVKSTCAPKLWIELVKAQG